MLHNRDYYNEFADWYEKERHHGYHALIDDLETDLLMPYCKGADALEVGCGTGLIMRRVSREARSVRGIDISPGMLEKARERGLDVQEGCATSLPYDDESFDTVYSFKVLAHVEDIRKAMMECARVTRPGGRMVLEFYNRRSVRYAAKRLTRPGAISAATNESKVYTRWDTLSELQSILPSDIELLRPEGVRVVTPAAAAMKIPGVRRVLRRAEFRLRGSRFGKYGGFLVLVLRKSL